jgi:hypothetical protein
MGCQISMWGAHISGEGLLLADDGVGVHLRYQKWGVRYRGGVLIYREEDSFSPMMALECTCGIRNRASDIEGAFRCPSCASAC